jgi:phosphocarrier protein
MQTTILKVKNDHGLHARPSALIVERLLPFKSSVTFICDDKKADARSVLSLMMLIAPKDSEIEIIVNGEDEKDVLNTIVELFDSKFIDAY